LHWHKYKKHLLLQIWELQVLENFLTMQQNLKDGEVEKGAHAGWSLKTTGTGGRASRVIYETLVCLTNSADS
jgi:hypothetical protein